MEIIDFSDYKNEIPCGFPKIVSFYSHIYKLPDGREKTNALHVKIENGDAAGVIQTIIEEGGFVSQQDDGTHVFIPWPCAVVEIKDA